MSPSSAGARFRAAVAAERPLQVVGCIYAYAARMAERVGFKAIYLSGAVLPRARWGSPISASRRWMMSSRTCAASPA